MAAVFQWAHDGGSPGFVMSVYVCECVCEDRPEWISGRWVTEKEMQSQADAYPQCPRARIHLPTDTLRDTQGANLLKGLNLTWCVNDSVGLWGNVPTLLEPEMSLSALWKHLSATGSLALISVTDEIFMLLPAKIYFYDAEIHCSCLEKL